jgi:hypothetical protein
MLGLFLIVYYLMNYLLKKIYAFFLILNYHVRDPFAIFLGKLSFESTIQEKLLNTSL